VYGATKLLMERLFNEYQKLNEDTAYRIVRYGNVLYSTGSVLCKWKDKMIRGDSVIITDPDATRFYWTVDEAINLIFSCLEKANSAEPFVPPMKSVRMGDLLEAMMDKYGRVEVIKTGLQQGESKHEIVHKDLPTSFEAPRFTIEEIGDMI
jgi:UDP-N-acetylglucosamine 4,6-dehydratase